ncbi:tRNA glutamyl-Q(34) synthetase GluQRS [Shewanella maritima]|uniref:tRNA glutamyl-Q(34) synthetase GluQRS n=1 Tax=Shewanella maritima TaxID=2520507 RepID=UPI003734E666
MSAYIGRFAPSPSGPLHFGSLIAALGSYLRAHSLNGQWLVRMEDLDPPREVAGASDNILRTLDAFGLHWHGSVLYQSQRHDAYQSCINDLLSHQQAYYCQCTRKQVQAMGGIYNGHCKSLTPLNQEGAVRVCNVAQVAQFTDVVMGQVSVDTAFASEDFIIKRRDGLYAYQLAVVLDDAFQGITEVVRGSDLLTSSCRQLSLFNQLNLPHPSWLHLPVACLEPGFKLSKQNHAQAINDKAPQASINAALQFLGQSQVDIDDVDTMLAQAVSQFDINLVPKQAEILI